MEYRPVLLPTVRALLEQSKGRWPEIAEATGVKYKTIRNIAQGHVVDPSVNTIEVLHRYLTGPQGENAA